MNAKREMLKLTCELSDAEMLAAARAGATAREELVRLDGAKAEFMNAHKAQVEEQQGIVANAHTCVRTGKERRLVECLVEFHKPVQGMKRTTRLDTGDLVSEDKMTPNEAQENLFEPPAEQDALPAPEETPAELPLEVSADAPAEESAVATGESYASDGQES